MTDAYYVYAVVPARAPALAAAAILPGAPVEALREGRVAALVSPIARATLEPRASDPDWMAARAVAHHDVLVAACAAGPCLPCSFGTLFSAPALITAWLAQREAALAAALGRVADAAEWSITLHEDRLAHATWLEAQDDELRGLAAAAASAGEGTAFLLRRRVDRLRAAACAARCEVLGARIATVLGRHAELAAGRAPRWTALVRDELAATLRAELAAIAAEVAASGLTLTLSGPWPPYGFAREAIGHDR